MAKVMKCTRINILTYIADFDSVMSSLSVYFARQQGLNNNGLLLGAYIDSEPCGIIIAREYGETLEILYMETREGYRRRGICGALVDYCLTLAREAGKKQLRLRYTESQTGFLGGYLQKRGFDKQPSAVTRIAPVTEAIKAQWGVFTATRGIPLMEKLKTKGYEAVCMETAPEAVAELYARMGTEFPRHLDLRQCPNEIMERHSFITLRNGLPAAYCIASTADGGQTAIIEYMASSARLLGTGAFLPSFIRCVQSVMEESTKIAWTIHDSNKKMNRLAENTLRFTDISVKPQCDYKFNL